MDKWRAVDKVSSEEHLGQYVNRRGVGGHSFIGLSKHFIIMAVRATWC